MTWEAPISQLNYLRAVFALTTFEFMLRWAGYGNLPGPDPRGWGDPIPFDEALRELPSLFMLAIAEVGALVLFYGIRSTTPQDARADARLKPPEPIRTVSERWTRQLTCPACSGEIRDRTTIVTCPHCGLELRFAEPSRLDGAVANVAGFCSALLSGLHGAGFLFTWFLSAYAVMGFLGLIIPPRLQPELPVEFHRALP